MNQFLEELHRDATEPENEYLQIFKINERYDRFHNNRDFYRREFSFAIPNREAINEIVKYSPLIEIGAGSGYWAYLIRKNGGKIVAFDNEERNRDWIEHRKSIFFTGNWFDVKFGDENKIKKYPNHTLFLCWVELGGDYGLKALKLYKGKHLIYIGEFEGDCCATDKFFKYLNKHFKEIKEIDIPKWNGLHDWFVIYERC